MADKETPFVTVLVTVGAKYATQELLGRALRSLTLQTYPKDRFEVLVVADGVSCEGLTRACSDNLTIRYHEYSESQGVGFASQKGLLLARGQCFARVDADDSVLPDWLSVLARALQKASAAKDIAYVYGGLVLVDDATGLEQECGLTEETVFNHGAGVVFIREHVLQVGGYTHHHNAEDHALFLRLWQHGFKGCSIPGYFYKYHRHGHNITNNAQGRREAVERVRRELLEREH